MSEALTVKARLKALEERVTKLELAAERQLMASLPFAPNRAAAQQHNWIFPNPHPPIQPPPDDKEE